jgi:group I intron endonuclease
MSQFLIYKATSPSNKCYIGLTTRSLSDRIKSHKCCAKLPKTKFHYAINKYGIDNFIWEIIYQTNNFEDLKEKEMFYIKHFNSIKTGYNITMGGEGSLGYKFNFRKRTSLQIEKMRKISSSLYGKSIVIITPDNRHMEFPSIGEASRVLNLSYTCLKLARKRKGSYKDHIIVDKNDYDPNKEYITKNSYNSKVFKLKNKNTNNVIIMKSILDLSKFLCISERKARNIYYKKTFSPDWEVSYVAVL